MSIKQLPSFILKMLPTVSVIFTSLRYMHPNHQHEVILRCSETEIRELIVHALSCMQRANLEKLLRIILGGPIEVLRRNNQSLQTAQHQRGRLPNYPAPLVQKRPESEAESPQSGSSTGIGSSCNFEGVNIVDP